MTDFDRQTGRSRKILDASIALAHRGLAVALLVNSTAHRDEMSARVPELSVLHDGEITMGNTAHGFRITTSADGRVDIMRYGPPEWYAHTRFDVVLFDHFVLERMSDLEKRVGLAATSERRVESFRRMMDEVFRLFRAS